VVNAQAPETLYLTATALCEVLIGIALLPYGKRKRGMELAMEKLLADLFGTRFLDFDREAAIAFAALGSRAAAKVIPFRWAIARLPQLRRCMDSAWRRGYDAVCCAGVPVINPWES